MKKVSIVLVLAMVFVLAIASAAFADAPSGTPISEELVFEASSEMEPATIFVNDDLATTAAVNTYDLFTVGTTPGSYGDTMVRVLAKCTSGNTSGFTMEYLEQDPSNPNYGKYLPLSFTGNEAWFGPTAGFPLQAVTDSQFKVNWLAAGTYSFELEVWEVDASGNPQGGTALATTTASVTVVEGMPMQLAWAGGEPGSTISVGSDFDIGVTASLKSGVSHVDNALFVIEVQKDGEGSWTAASTDDFEITAVNGSSDTQGINTTFSPVTKEGGISVLQGHWGPRSGFTFETETTTTMTAHFNNAGDYKVTIYAIQVDMEQP